MNLEVGMYIRPKDGLDGIGILKEIDGLSLKVEFKNYTVTNTANYYKKASYEPIDLIEEGDYVNGCKVIKIFKNRVNNKKVLISLQREEEYEYSDCLNDYMGDESIHIYNENIKSIVTKEQFEHISYDVV